MWHLVPFLGLLAEASGNAAPGNASWLWSKSGTRKNRNASVPQNSTSSGHLVQADALPTVKNASASNFVVHAVSTSDGVLALSSDPTERAKELSKKMEEWCMKIWDHNSEWGGYAVQRFEDNEALAEKFANALRDGTAKQAALFASVPRDDPMAKMAVEQSDAAKKIEEDLMKAKSGYFAARAARHQWKVIAEAITLVDKTDTITCNQEKDMTAKFEEVKLLQMDGGASRRSLLSKRQGQAESLMEPNAKDVALKHLEARKDRLDKMIAWCAAQDAAAEAAKKAKENMISRTDFQKELHEKAIEKIEEKAASFTEMCDSFVDDLKEFADVATSEKVSYAKMAESVPAAFSALLDTAHRAWMSWRRDIQKSYDDLKDRCDKLRYIMDMRIVGRQEQIQALPEHEDQDGDGWPDVCPTDEELKAERMDIEEKITEVNSWDDHMLDEAQKKAGGAEHGLVEKEKKKKRVKKSGFGGLFR